MNTLQNLFAHKSWANQELFNRLAELPSPAAAPEHAAALHSAIRMLNHIHVVDCIFCAHLLAQAHGHTATNTEATPSLGELHFAVAQTDAWFEQYAASATPQQLAERVQFEFTDGDTGTMTREEMLVHVITHGSYHRGNVGQILKSIDIAPPRDLFTRFLHVSEPRRCNKA